MQQIIDTVRGFPGALVVVPDETSPYPELAWGDAFFYYAPEGTMPERTQPYATVITKDYPDDRDSLLTGGGRFRLNINVGRDEAGRLVDSGTGPADADIFVLHPIYGTAGWVSVVNPGSRTAGTATALLRDAHDAARARALRREQGE